MSKLLGAGKAVAAVFWGVILINLVEPLAQPFALLLHLAGVAIILIHGLELWLFADQIGRSPSPWMARVQIALFGVFHVLTLAAQAEPEAQGSLDEVQLDAGPA